jgi:hypothetical protein
MTDVLATRAGAVQDQGDMLSLHVIR